MISTIILYSGKEIIAKFKNTAPGSVFQKIIATEKKKMFKHNIFFNILQTPENHKISYQLRKLKRDGLVASYCQKNGKNYVRLAPTSSLILVESLTHLATPVSYTHLTLPTKA